MSYKIGWLESSYSMDMKALTGYLLSRTQVINNNDAKIVVFVRFAKSLVKIDNFIETSVAAKRPIPVSVLREEPFSKYQRLP